jgi:phosphatidylserine decarboxylase
VALIRSVPARDQKLRPNRMFIFQVCILAISIGAVGLLVVDFPYPSPLIKPFLPPKLRWPDAQISHWAEAQNYDPGFLEFFMRDPDRSVPSGDNLVSAADGVVKEIIYKNETTYLVIGLSFWDVHVVRTPVAGVVKSVEQEGVSFYRDASESKDQVYLRGKDSPVQQIVTLNTEYGQIKVRLITSYIASRLKVWVYAGERLGKGQRIGRILLGSTVVVEIPGHVHLSVKQKQRIVAGETIILKGQRLR